MSKAKQNTEYLEKLDRSIRQLEEGKVVVKTMEELEAMAIRR
jgi:antitoxin YefM